MRRVLLSTDRRSLIEMIQRTRGLEVVDCISPRMSLPSAAQRPALDVVLVDQCAAAELALQRLGEAERWLTDAKRVLLSDRLNAAWLDAAFVAGAHAVIARTVAPVHLGILVLELADDHVMQRPCPAAGTLTHETPLSPRELEILRLAARGWSNRRIAARLWVTEQTVKFHLSNTYRKLGVVNRTEATRYAHLHALLGHDELPQPA